MEDLWKWTTSAMASFMAIFITLIGWGAKRQVSRIDALEKSKANRESTNDRLERAFEAVKEHQQEDREMHSKLLEEIGKTNAHLANIEGRLSKE